MSRRGVFAVDRGIWDDPDFPNEPFSEREAFLWLVSEAAWRATKVRVGSRLIELERGQCSFSTRFMAAKFQWSEARVRRFLKRRSDLNQVCTKINAGATQVTICKYDVFQRVGSLTDAEATQERRSSDAKKKQLNMETDTNEANASSVSRPDDIRLAFDAWNEIAAKAGLPTAKALTPTRRSQIKARLLEVGGLAGWVEALQRLAASSFCTGRKTDFRADLDFVLQPKSFTRLSEGSYDDRPQPTGAQHEQHRPYPQRGPAGLASHLDNIVARSEFRGSEFSDREGPGRPTGSFQERDVSHGRGASEGYGGDRGITLRAVSGGRAG